MFWISPFIDYCLISYRLSVPKKTALDLAGFAIGKVRAELSCSINVNKLPPKFPKAELFSRFPFIFIGVMRLIILEASSNSILDYLFV